MLTQSRLKELLHYDPTLGIGLFTWIKPTCNRIKSRSVAGTINSKGYVVIAIDGKNYKAHRLAYLYMTGKFPELFIDHEDTVRQHNWWSNLREATNGQIQMNSPIRKGNKAGVKGVCWNKKAGKWFADIKANDQRFYLGLFVNIEDAAEAVRLKRIELHGEFANHG